MMEDYRKQLPLRQQKDRPTLKYSTGGYGGGGSPMYPVYNRSTATNGSSNAPLDNYFTDSYFGARHRSLFYGTQASTTTAKGLTPAQILAANIQTSTKVSNPYSRPISAQDVKKPTIVEKPVVGSGSNSSLGSSNGSSGSRVSPSSSSLQTNSFMRPQSAVVPNESVNGNNSKIQSATGIVTASKSDTAVELSAPTPPTDPHYDKMVLVEESMTNGTVVVPRVPSVVSPEFLMTQPAPRPPSALRPGSARPASAQQARNVVVNKVRTLTSESAASSTASAMTQSAGQLQQQSTRTTQSSTTTSASNKRTMTPAATNIVNVGLPPKTPQNNPKPTQNTVRTPQTSASAKPAQNVASAKSSTTTTNHRTTPTPPTNRFTDRFTGRPGSASEARPGSASSRGFIGSSRPGTPGSSETSVRNPNYTPSKPYSEVSNPSPTLTATGSRVGKHELKKSSTEPAIKVSIDSTTRDTSTVKVNGDPKGKVTNTKAKVTSSAGGGTLEHHPVKKMPVTNTLTGTVFYHKSSKGEEILSHTKHRPRADGSSAKLKVKDIVKVAEDEDDDEDEWTDEEEMGSKVNRERSPGDGADSSGRDYEDDDDDDDDAGRCLDDDDDDDDEAIDDLNDDYCVSDDGSSTFSITASSRRSSASSRISSASSTRRVRSATRGLQKLSLTSPGGKARPHTAATTSSSTRGRSVTPDGERQPALMPSLFPNIPPTVNFVLDGEKVEQLPWEFRKLLKWRMSPITPNVVKNCIARSGFRYSKKNHDWLGYWGKHMKAQGFTAIRPYQKVNHFPGSFQIGRKDRLWRNLSKMQAHHGKKDFGFFPQTFVLPFDMKQLKRAFEDGGNKQKWIIKPPASARGIGIKVISKWCQIPKKRSVIVQRYLGRPYLINESKFDLRVYVYVTSYDPLRIYVFDDGLARFASCKYSYSMKNINNKYMHLTNYSINKKNEGYEANSDENVCQGHKWGLKALWGYMKKHGVNTTAVWDSIKDLVVKTIISSESCVNSMVKANVKKKSCCHELFGFDVMLDENLKPWIIEVNISPSLHSNSQLDMNIKGGMIRDLMNLAGFMLPDKADVVQTMASLYDCKSSPPNPLVIDKRLYPSTMAPDERAKHAYYCQRHLDEFAQATIADILTPDDIRILVETIDEDSRRGNFQRAFPSPTSHGYLRYMEQPRYYNLLLNQWTQKYHRMESRGIALLESLCAKGIHLENPTDDPRHQWVPPSSTLPRDRGLMSGSESAHAKGRPLPTLRKKKPDTGSSSSRPPTARSAGSMASS